MLQSCGPGIPYRSKTTSKNGNIPYGLQITPGELPQVYTPEGVNVLASGDPKKVPANTVMDVNRYQQDLAALSPESSAIVADSERDRPSL